MTNRQIRQQIKKLGGKADVANVERTAFSVNASEAEKRARRDQARDRGILGVPIDPRTVNDPRKWYEGRPLEMPKNPEIEAMKAARRKAGGDKFPR
jgi:hypothetical protein